MSTGNLLITLLPSTDVDLGRWILQHHGVRYTERPHAPVFHVLALKVWGVSADDYPLFVEQGAKYPGDPTILTHLEAAADPDSRLLPVEQSEPDACAAVQELQHYARITVGNEVVNWSYFNLLQHKRAVWPSITTGVPWYEKLFCLLAFPVLRTLMYKGLKLDQAVSDAALKKIYAGFDRLDEMLSDGREYLVADRLTYADLAVAASLGPMVLVQGYQGFLPNQASCPAEMQSVYQQLRARPTGQFIQRMYDRHRKP